MIRSITHCLNPQLQRLCQRVIQINELNDLIQTNLPSPLNENCQAGSFAQGCLLILTSKAVWSTELRYLLPELRDKLRKAGLYQLASIKIAVVDDNDNLTKLQNKISLSPMARHCLLAASELCSYQPLSALLCQLAKR